MKSRFNKIGAVNLNIKPLVEMALAEDIGSGDITTEAVIPARARAGGVIVAGEEGIIAGLGVAELVFKIVKERGKVRFKAKVKDGGRVKKGQVVAEISGSAGSILMAERTALNFLQRLSGIATFTAEFVGKVQPSPAKIMDTRKTTPGWRALEKYAVRMGGGCNHRRGLYDGVLIKDNHIKVMGYELRANITPTLTLPPPCLRATHRQAVCARRTGRHQGGGDREGGAKRRQGIFVIGEVIKLVRGKVPRGTRVEIEVKNLREVREAVQAGADIIMLDNMNIAEMKKAVKIVHASSLVPPPLLEASGGVGLHNVKEIARTGVDIISVGALTHSAKGLDMSLKLDPFTPPSPLGGED